MRDDTVHRRRNLCAQKTPLACENNALSRLFTASQATRRRSKCVHAHRSSHTLEVDSATSPLLRTLPPSLFSHLTWLPVGRHHRAQKAHWKIRHRMPRATLRLGVKHTHTHIALQARSVGWPQRANVINGAWWRCTTASRNDVSVFLLSAATRACGTGGCACGKHFDGRARKKSVRFLGA